MDRIKPYLPVVAFFSGISSVLSLSLWITSLFIVHKPPQLYGLYIAKLFGIGSLLPAAIAVWAYLRMVGTSQLSALEAEISKSKQEIDRLEIAVEDRDIAVRNANIDIVAITEEKERFLRDAENQKLANDELEKKIGACAEEISNLKLTIEKQVSEINRLLANAPSNGVIEVTQLASYLIELCLHDVGVIEVDLENEKGPFVQAKNAHLGTLRTYVELCDGRFTRDRELLNGLDSNDTESVRHFNVLKQKVIELLRAAFSILDESENTIADSQRAITAAHQKVRQAKDLLQAFLETLTNQNV